VAIYMEIYEKIRYLHEHEALSQRGIAKRLGVSRNTVKKYFEGSCVPWERQGTSGRVRYVVTEEVTEFINECLLSDETENIRKQKHTAKRIYDRLVNEKEFLGGESTIREMVTQMRAVSSKVFIPLSFDPGEAMQIDWGEATVYIAGEKLKVNLWCMRECYSADIFCKAFYRQNEESFLEGQVSGYEHFGGAPHKAIFDNAKVAVKEGFGAHAKAQARYIALSAHYAFKPEFCNVAAGHEKGLVEGLVGWVRRNIFVPLPRVPTLEELNAEILRRCLKYREHIICGREQSVGIMAQKAMTMMTALPKFKFDTSKSIIAKVDDLSTVRFDCNNYSVPFKYGGKDITVKGYGNEVVMLSKNVELARYSRCYSKGATKYRLEHYIDLIEQRPRSAYNAKPVKNNISTELMDIGKRLSSPREMVKLLRMYIDYGEERLMTAIRNILGNEISINQIQAHLMPVNLPTSIQYECNVKVEIPHFGKYDSLIKGGDTL
jgi:transposase